MGPASTTQAAAGHLLISLLGRTTRCTDRQILASVVGYWLRHSSPALHIAQRPMTVAGAPALLITGLPGRGNAGVNVLVADAGLLYGLYAFDSPRTALTSGERQVLAQLRFIPRAGRLPPHYDNSIARALRECGSRL